MRLLVLLVGFSGLAFPATAQSTRFGFRAGLISYSETLTTQSTEIETQMTALTLGTSGLTTFGQSQVAFYASGSLLLPRRISQESGGETVAGDLDTYDTLIGSHLMFGLGGMLVDTQPFALAVVGGPRLIFLGGGFSEYVGYPIYSTFTYSFFTTVFGVQADMIMYAHLSDEVYLFADIELATDFYASGSMELNGQNFDTSGSVDAGSWAFGTGIGFKISDR